MTESVKKLGFFWGVSGWLFLGVVFSNPEIFLWKKLHAFKDGMTSFETPILLFIFIEFWYVQNWRENEFPELQFQFCSSSVLLFFSILSYFLVDFQKVPKPKSVFRSEPDSDIFITIQDLVVNMSIRFKFECKLSWLIKY